MNNIQQIVRIFMPAVKGSPIILGLVAICVFIASKIVYYATPMYECTGRMKLEDANMGISNTNLFKDFDIFSHPNKIIAEVEVIKSPELLKYAVSRIPIDVSYYRIGKIRTTELFKETPFIVKYKMLNPSLFGKEFNISFEPNGMFQLSYTYKDHPKKLSGSFDKPIEVEGSEFTISQNTPILVEKPQSLAEGPFSFSIYSTDQLVSQVSKDLDVKELDKDVQIVRIIYKNPIPEKAMIITNAVMEAYIEDGILTKKNVAEKTVHFIDSQTNKIAEQLDASEQALERYKLSNKITNTRMEVETGLKKVAEMKIQLSNIEMNLATLDTLNAYVNIHNPEDFLNKAPNYEGYGGLLYTELMKRLKGLQADKKDLLQKYKPESDQIKALDEKIADVVQYVTQNIFNARKSMEIQRNKIIKDIRESEKFFVDIPTKEKDLVILERNFQLNQTIYNFLTEKRTEAAIAEAATLSFHRIIQRADLPDKPVSPKKTFTMLVFGFLGFLFGIIIVYVYDAVSSRIKYKDQLEKTSNCPVLGDIVHEYSNGASKSDFFSLASKLNLKSKEPKIIAICSGVDGEGKTFIVEKLSKAFALMGIETLAVHSDLRNKNGASENGFEEFITQDLDIKLCVQTSQIPKLHIMPHGNSGIIPEAIFATEDLPEKLQSLKNRFKIIIFDTPSFDTALDAIPIIKSADYSLFVFRSNFTKTNLAIEPDLLKAEYEFENINLVLNDVQSFTKMKKDRGIRKVLTLFLNKTIRTIKNKFNKN